MQKWLFNISCAAISIMIMSSVVIVFASDKQDVNYLPVMEEVKVSNLETEKVFPLQTKELIQLSEHIEKEEQEAKALPVFTYSGEWSDKDIYLLAKIAMAEAESCSTQCKTLVILSVLNRVKSDLFPDSIQAVIYQCNAESNAYQFSCISNGRWDKVEPNQDCYEAVSVVKNLEYDYSGGALYFESCEEENWHSRNLNFLYQCDELRFYK